MYLTPDTPAPASRTPETGSLTAFRASEHPLPPAAAPSAGPVVTEDEARRGKWAAVAPFDAKLAMRFCELVALGHSTREIRDLLPFPDPGTFLIWVAQHPELAIAYRASRELSSYSMEDEALALARASVRDSRTATQLRAEETLIGQLRWSAVKRNPGVFSEKAAVQLVVPIQINTTLDLGGSPATGGNAEFPNIYEMQADVLRDTSTADIPDEHIFGVQPGDVGSPAGGEEPGLAGPPNSGAEGEEEGNPAIEASPAQSARRAGARGRRKAPPPAQGAATPGAAGTQAAEEAEVEAGVRKEAKPEIEAKQQGSGASVGGKKQGKAARGTAVVDAAPKGAQEGGST